MNLENYYTAVLRFSLRLFTGILCSIIAFTNLQGQSAHKLKLDGDRNYDKQDFSAAELSYRKAIQEESEFQSNFNLGNSLMQQNRAEEAAEYYKLSIDKTTEKKLQNKAWHNLGNALYKAKDYENSVEAFKNAIRLNSEDDETRRNLALAKKRLKETHQDKSEGKNEQNDENDDEKSENNDEKSENNDEKDENSSQDQHQQRHDQKPDNEKRELPQSEIDKLLQQIEADENKIQQRVIKSQSKSEKRSRDW